MLSRLVLIGPAAAVVLLLATPVAGLVARAAGVGGLPAALGDPAVRGAFALTVACATAATLVGALLGVPTGYLLARHDFPAKRWIEGLIELPVVIPHPVAGIAILLVCGRATPLGAVLARRGLAVVGTPLGIVTVMLFVGLPFVVTSAREGFALIDPRLEAMARTLGVGPLGAAVRVALPVAARPIAAGAVLMWARAVSEFGAIAIVSYNPQVASVLVYDRFTSYGLAGALPPAALLVGLALAVLVALRGLARPAVAR
ncbi:MAG TPA: ABC transporter permease [Candidatus Binatia bacterium]|nr:ABC transporter permease [Candidatus Binatia bacterium]